MQKKLRHNIDIIKRKDTYTLVWNVKNLSSKPFVFKKGIALLDEDRNSSHPRFIPMEFTEGNTIPSGAEGTLLIDELCKDKVSNYRFWLANYPKIGIEEATTLRYWISVSQFTKLMKKLNNLAIEWGLNAEIEEGLQVCMKENNKEIDKAIAGNGTESIMSIEYHEGFVEGGATVDDITQEVNV